MANNYFHRWTSYMAQKNHHSTDSSGKQVYSINLTSILSTYRDLISIEGDHQLDLRRTEFGDLIRFEKKKTCYRNRVWNKTTKYYKFD